MLEVILESNGQNRFWTCYKQTIIFVTTVIERSINMIFLEFGKVI